MLKNDLWINQKASEGMIKPFQSNLVRHLEPNNKHLKKSIHESTIELWNFCKKELQSGDNDQIILDEIFLAIDMKIIDKDDLISTLENRFISGDVILTCLLYTSPSPRDR